MEIHPVDGDRIPGPPGTDAPYIGFELLKTLLNTLDMDKYQYLAMTTKKYPESYKLIYPTLGLTGEAGELANKVKKILRDDEGKIGQKKAEQIFYELGDCLWYIAAIADDLGIPLTTVADANLRKLKKRDEEDKIKGEGDNR
jgi:NTP pyrophosphatase (non-canonical NTP hydrolase)